MNWCVQQCTCTCTRFQLTQSARYRGKQQRTKESGLITEFSYNVKPTFYPRTVFCHQHPLPEGVFNCRWRADNCIVYYRTGGGGGGKGKQLQCLWFLRRGLCTQKSTAVGSYRTFKIFAHFPHSTDGPFNYHYYQGIHLLTKE